MLIKNGIASFLIEEDLFMRENHELELDISRDVDRNKAFSPNVTFFNSGRSTVNEPLETKTS